MSQTVFSREERMELGHAFKVRQESRGRFAGEGTTVVHQMHLIVEVVIVSDVRPRPAGQL